MHARTSPSYAQSPVYFSLLLMVALIGFFPSYYGRLGQASLAHHFHGIASTLWLLLLITQGFLMRQRKVQLHRALGKASIVLALAFVVSGLMIVRTMLTADNPFARAFGPPLAFVNLSTMLYFAFAYGMALYHRKDVQLHARYMVCTAVPLLVPALSRTLGRWVLPPGSSVGFGLHLSFLAAELIVVALLLDDKRRGKVRAPYLILLAVLLVQQASFELSMDFAPWAQVVRWLGAS